MKKGLSRILPSYSWIPMFSVICFNILAYYATKPIAHAFHHFDFSLSIIDQKLPFIPFFSLIYVLAYVQWVVGLVLIARENREFCYKTLSGEIISKLICSVLFIVIPTTMVRAEVTSDDIFSSLVRLLYSIDTPENLFPSIHCLESWLCFRASVQMKKTGKLFMYANLIFSLLVFASVLFIKQHVVIDVIGGIAVCEIGQLIAKKSKSARLFEKAESLIARKSYTETSNEKNS